MYIIIFIILLFSRSIFHDRLEWQMWCDSETDHLIVSWEGHWEWNLKEAVFLELGNSGWQSDVCFYVDFENKDFCWSTQPLPFHPAVKCIFLTLFWFDIPRRLTWAWLLLPCYWSWEESQYEQWIDAWVHGYLPGQFRTSVVLEGRQESAHIWRMKFYWESTGGQQ